MADEYIELKRDFISQLDKLPTNAVVVYLFLLARQKEQKTIKVGLTLAELARQTDLGTATVERGLKDLVAAGLINMEEKGKNFLITVDVFYTAEKPTPIPFTYKNTDETKIATLEKELQRMQLAHVRAMNGRESGIANACKGEERDILAEIEHDLGRGFTFEECYTLGKCMSAFGPERIKTTWRKKAATAKNPIRALVAMMWNGTIGSPAKEREQKPAERPIRDL